MRALGSLVEHALAGGSWAYRYRDERRRRRQTGGFKTNGEARDALDTTP